MISLLRRQVGPLAIRSQGDFVVDDSSEPPLTATPLDPEAQDKYNIRVVRHPETIGRTGSKDGRRCACGGHYRLL